MGTTMPHNQGMHLFDRSPFPRSARTALPAPLAAICAIVMCLALAGCGAIGTQSAPNGDDSSLSGGSPSAASSSAALPSPADSSSPDGSSSPAATDDSPQSRARAMVASMSLEERIGQLVMVPLFAGTDASQIEPLIRNNHVGSVLVLGKWKTGVAGVAQATKALQSYAPAGNGLIIATDQEGGSVQHLTGEGFSTMPSAVRQGKMSTDALRESAATWGEELASAGVNVDLAPVLDTVRVARKSNAPIGALNRDFGLDAAGNADHGMAFVQGMLDAGVQSAVKHYPGLGGVTGNTDFTAEGITDRTTALGDDAVAAFDDAIGRAQPAMVMMSLATYANIDGSAPAAFSKAIVTDHLRGKAGYQGVVISDSLSAEALGGIATDQLGVRLVEAGGDLACIGASDYVRPIIDGLVTRAKSDAAFADLVADAATRVMTLKIGMGLAG